MNEPPKANTLDFFNIKSASYRNYHADGAVGGKTPGGDIHVSFFVERGAIPKRMRYEVLQDGALGSVVETEGKSGVVRDIECGVIISVKAATELRDWLTKIIEKG